jgi:MoaA/NifB/PqqE/SkfB family radical SAM enzyme
MNNSSVYCTAPWNGLTIREDGKVKTCCVGLTSLGNLNSESITDIEKSDTLQNIRKSMLNGKPDEKNCVACINDENQSGLASLKEHYNKYYPEFDHDNLQLKFLDVRWNNTCNLNCLYCSPVFSSTWGDKQGIKLSKPVKPYQDDLLAWILKKSNQVNEIMLVGGEPMLMKQNYELLAHLPEHCAISIITNLSYSLEDLPCMPDLLRRPADKIIWNISVDNTHKQFEYVRSGASWSQFEKNLIFLIKHWPNTPSINIVYSMFSAFELTNTIKTFAGLNVKKFNFQPISNNPTMDLFNMPMPIKQQARQELEQAQQWHIDSLHPEDRQFYPLQGAEQLLQSLNSESTNQIMLSAFQEKINWYNQWSSVSFETLWPDIIPLVNAHLSN